MITRRDFVGTSLAATLGTGAALADYRLAVIARSPARKPDTVVVDLRFEESRQFGRVLERHGATVRAFDGDVTDLWFSQLDPLWRARQASVAGLTSFGVLFCLERLAWDHGMRMVHRARHTPLAGGPTLYSWLIALPFQRS